MQRLATPASSAVAESADAEAGKPASAQAAPGGGGDASGAQKKAPHQEAALSAALPAITFWITMSCATILYNKYLYTSADNGGGNFRYPLSLASIHMAFATVATNLLRAAGVLKVPVLEWRFILRSVLPIGFLFAMSLGFSNLAALRLTVSFIQMVKALTPLMALAISVSMGMEVATRSLVFGAARQGAILPARARPRALWPSLSPGRGPAAIAPLNPARPPQPPPPPPPSSTPRPFPASGEHDVRGRGDRVLRRD